MSDLLARLRTALADRYDVESQVGRGGMAIVYRARDLKHDRFVAIKVLHPELAATLGSDRFLHEIQIAAKLNHPHILPLHDSGEADGLVYYVMPFVAGESLRARLNREKQLPVDDALQITREVADALSYAHSHDVIHRDVKPENILLESGHAVVTDFGIALAVSHAGADRATQAGMAMGTPGYMSPEQAAGMHDLDGRSDMYSLGCVLHEMLSGQPPFSGPTVESIVRQQLVSDPPSITTIRPAVPAEVAEALVRVLSKTPADRYATAQQFREALTPAGVATGPRRRRSRRRALSWALAAGVLTAAATLGVWRMRSTPEVPALDSTRVAVLPFRVTVSDESLEYLREGMMDLLNATLTGEGGRRAADSRTVITAWRRAGGSAQRDLTRAESRQLGRDLGAGRVLLGQVVGTATHIEVTASLVGTSDDESYLDARVSGPPDSLHALIDTLTAQLLTLQAEEYHDRLGTLTSYSVSALRAYLDGQVAYRNGAYNEAISHYAAALRHDSTFALAALGFAGAWGWTEPRVSGDAQALRLAWKYRDRLNERDAAVLTARAGPRYPFPPSTAEALAAWERAVELAPDRAEAWYELGDNLFHWGPVLGLDAPVPRALHAFHRALDLDSSFAPVLDHLVPYAAGIGDTVFLRYLLPRLPQAVAGRYNLALTIASVLSDSTGLDSLRHRLDRVSDAELLWVVASAQQRAGVSMEAAERAAALLEARRSGYARLWIYALNRGRPEAARRFAHESGQVVPGARYFRIWDALYADGDTAAALAAVQELAPVAAAPLSNERYRRSQQFEAICAVEQWRLWHGTTNTAARGIEVLRGSATPDDSTDTVLRAHICASVLEALLATARRDAHARRALESLDSLLLTGPGGPSRAWPLINAWNLMAARAWEAHGDPARALAAARRRMVYNTSANLYLASMLHQEGRMAAFTGDYEGAIRAYQYYLTLRSNPEPALRPQADEVRAELARLVGEPQP
jgi:serine/threonine-protein kinase